jgi:hypothetical protein
MDKRNRGFILTDAGLRKLQTEIDQRLEARELSSKSAQAIAAFVKQHVEHDQTIGLSTIRKIQKQKNTDYESLDKLFRALDLTLKDRDYSQCEGDDGKKIPPSSGPNNLPFSGTEAFVGRDTQQTELHQALQHHQMVALVGMGGVGKTELTLQYARHFAEAYPGGICWIFARPMDTHHKAPIANQIVSFAVSRLGLKIPNFITDAEAKLQYCWQHWRKGNVLLIYDDVEAYRDISPQYVPTDERFRILITTRLQLGPPVHRLPVEVLHRDDSLELLAFFAGHPRTQDNPDADGLCEFLGDLPLGVELAGRYLEQDPNLSATALLNELRKRVPTRQVVQHEVMQGDYQSDPAWTLTARRGVEAAFDLTWEKLSDSTHLLSKMLGRFEPGPIDWDTVEIMREVLAEVFPETGDYNPQGLQRSRADLIVYSLLKPFQDGIYRLHPLIREFFRGKTTDEEDAQYGTAIVQ